MSTFDIASLDFSDTTEITINDPRTNEPFLVDVELPDGEGGKKVAKRPMTVTVHGPGSRQFKAAQAVSQKAHAATFSRGKSRETPEQKEAREANFLSACTVSFNGFTYNGGDPTDRETFRACYLDPKRGWLTEQINTELGDWANFKATAQSS